MSPPRRPFIPLAPPKAQTSSIGIHAEFISARTMNPLVSLSGKTITRNWRMSIINASLISYTIAPER